MLPCPPWPTVRPACHCTLPSRLAPQPRPTRNSRCTDTACGSQGEVSPRITAKISTGDGRPCRILLIKEHFWPIQLCSYSMNDSYMLGLGSMSPQFHLTASPRILCIRLATGMLLLIKIEFFGGTVCFGADSLVTHMEPPIASHHMIHHACG